MIDLDDPIASLCKHADSLIALNNETASASDLRILQDGLLLSAAIAIDLTWPRLTGLSTAAYHVNADLPMFSKRDTWMCSFACACDYLAYPLDMVNLPVRFRAGIVMRGQRAALVLGSWQPRCSHRIRS